MKIGLFVGSDVISHLMVNKLIPALCEENHTPYVFQPNDATNRKRRLPELEELAFYERILLNKIIYPFLDTNPAPEGVAFRSIRNLSTQHGIETALIDNINDQNFSDHVTQEGIRSAFSLRCYQKFGKELITYFNQNGFIGNLHPGILPQYRGVITTIRAMANGDAEHGYSLHHIDEQWDAGPLIDVRKTRLDLSKPMLSNNRDAYMIGVNMILDAVRKAAGGQELTGTPQDERQIQYFSFPTEEELALYRGKNLRFLDRGEMRQLYLNGFSVQDTRHYRDLSAIVDKAIEEHGKR